MLLLLLLLVHILLLLLELVIVGCRPLDVLLALTFFFGWDFIDLLLLEAHVSTRVVNIVLSELWIPLLFAAGCSVLSGLTYATSFKSWEVVVHHISLTHHGWGTSCHRSLLLFTFSFQAAYYRFLLLGVGWLVVACIGLDSFGLESLRWTTAELLFG
jgi:hypothetical protein